MSETMTADAGRTAVFDRITRLARNIFGVDIAAVSLIEAQRQHFQSIQGMALTAIPLEDSFCRATWREGRRIVIPDTAVDGEFADHPLVTQTPHLRSYVGLPLKTSEGEAIGTMCVIDRRPRIFSDRELAILEDLAQLAASEFELHGWATLDTLTGAVTRRVFEKHFARMREVTGGKGLPISIILLDIDHFKSVNDRFGHRAGDEVLTSVAAACRGNLRDHDILGRLGGEEFGVALAGDKVSAALVAERLRSAIAALQFTFAGQPLQVTGSFGVAALGSGPTAIADAILAADAALYAAKTGGRNRVVTAAAAAAPTIAE